MQTSEINLDLPPAFEFLFTPSRYKVAYGGRGSAKSWNFSRALIANAYTAPRRILCAREQQNSIRESVHELLRSQIDSAGLTDWFDVNDTVITGHLGSEFIFSGIKSNVTKIKSMEGIDIVWVEEAEKVSERSWEVLIPTIRKPGSEIWVSYNPDQESDPTHRRFVLEPPDDALVRKVSWRDNPWFPEELRREKDYLARVDVDAYSHVWEGECRVASDAQIFRGKYTSCAFDVPVLPKQPTEAQKAERAKWDGPYLGADWGFSRDPTCLVKLWIYERKLFIEHEAYGIGVDLHRTGAMFERVPGAKERPIRADNARPETISYLQQHGFPNVVAAEKWPGSVEDGIAFLRQFEQIVIHPRCTHAIQEARLYSYKTDRLTGDVLAEVIDAHNHIWDAVRYALQPMIRNVNTGLLLFYQQEAEAKREKAAKR